MTYSFHPEAENEFTQAINYYENSQQELGYDFSIEVHSAVQRILAYPKLWPFIEDEVRRSLVKRFPFGVLYHYNKGEEHIFIVAVMHLHRQPGYWRHRY